MAQFLKLQLAAGWLVTLLSYLYLNMKKVITSLQGQEYTCVFNSYTFLLYATFKFYLAQQHTLAEVRTFGELCAVTDVKLADGWSVTLVGLPALKDKAQLSLSM